MTAALAPLGDTYTAADLEHMPDDALRYEVLDGALTVSPAPVNFHTTAAWLFALAVNEQLPAEYMAMNGLQIGSGASPNALIPDMVITTRAVAHALRPCEPEEVLVAVEFVSPGSQRRDRVYKPDRYAAWGIPCYWRVEPAGDAWHLVELRLKGDSYEELGIAEGTFRTTEPFPLSIPLPTRAET